MIVCLDLVYLLYADIDDERVVPYLEEKFIEGMERLYKKKMSQTEIRQKTDMWKNKKVGVNVYYTICLLSQIFGRRIKIKYKI